MANVVQDPKQHPKAIVADFATPNPLVTFKPEDVDFTYGSKWKQRYWKKQGDDYFVLPAQWDVRHKVWRPYHVQPGTDWWVEHYPAEQEARPTGPLCDGCHSVNYDIKTHAVTEWNVGLRALPRGRRRSRRAPNEGRTSSIPLVSTMCDRTTCASSATRRAGRGRIRSRAGTTTGPSAISPVTG